MDDSGDYCRDGDCATGPTCFRHKLRSIQFTPSCTPTRRNTIPPRTPQNSWERGVATDDRGMPLLDKNLSPIGLKEAADIGSSLDSQIRTAKTPKTNSA